MGVAKLLLNLLEIIHEHWIRIIRHVHKSGDIHLMSILLAHIIFAKKQLLWHVIFFDAGQLFITNEALYYGHVARASNALHRRFVCINHPVNEHAQVTVPVVRFISACQDRARG